MPFEVIENIFRIFELLITTFEISVDGVLLAIVQSSLFDCIEFVRTMITGHIEILMDFLVIGFSDLCWSNG